MRVLQIGVFVVGLVTFFVALAVAGDEMGDILWRVGVALMLIDLVIIKLWPGAGGRGAA